MGRDGRSRGCGLEHGFRPEIHPKLLDHRAHRPRQEHAGRPAPAPIGGDHPARVPRAAPRRHGPGARAGDHDQGAGGGDQLHARRPGLRAEPDRHAGARRFPLRGLAEPGRVRGGDPAGRRHAGGAGADRGQRLPGGGQRPGDRAGAQQDRHAGVAARDGQGRDHDQPRDRPRRGPGRQRQDGPGRPRRLPRDHRARPAPGRRPATPRSAP